MTDVNKAGVSFSIDGFREQLLERATGGTPNDDAAHVRASFDTAVEVKEDGTSRNLIFTITTSNVDRMGDTIAMAGWKLDAYRKNPVVLWAHDSSLLPLAKSEKIWIEGDKMKSDTAFTPPGMARFNDTVFDMYKGGFLSATSVGFIPLKYAFTDDPTRRFGIDFLEQELLEFSCVPVPANAEALIEGKAAGIDIAPILDFAEATLKTAFEAERIIKLAESALGGRGDDPVVIAWAERIVAATGNAIVSRERIERIERAATAERLRKKREREAAVVVLGLRRN